MREMVKELQKMIKGKRHIVFFGGAGVSTESGLKDFRGEEGLDRENNLYTPEEVLSSRFFYYNTEAFYTYYRKYLLRKAKPNAAHFWLAEMERKGCLDGVITQNIDGLHQMAGSRNVVELHGSVLRNFCTRCHRAYTADDVRNSSHVPMCSCGGVIKPDVVLYGESLKTEDINRAIRLIDGAELLIVGGTSLSVYPAAGFVSGYRGDMVIINKTKTPMDSRADLLIQAPIGALFQQLKEESE